MLFPAVRVSVIDTIPSDLEWLGTMMYLVLVILYTNVGLPSYARLIMHAQSAVQNSFQTLIMIRTNSRVISYIVDVFLLDSSFPRCSTATAFRAVHTL